VQLPEGASPEQPPPFASVTVTVPDGVPPDELTVKLTVIACPGSDGSGVSPVIVVVVLAGGGGGWAVTVCPSSSELGENPGAPE
jgi:hypothetical protein